MYHMEKRERHSTPAKKRRTTLSLPAGSLSHAARITRARKVSLSTVIAEALSDGLQRHLAAERGEQILRAYKTAFAGLSDVEMSLVDGVILEPKARK
ncbi:exported hypothetical protein [Candidatus Sulfopaludibacter sp. SbA3]|nr:exported hypothetical protein [Candidatus Sulfopaludibacter sp. SbA3]